MRLLLVIVVLCLSSRPHVAPSSRRAESRQQTGARLRGLSRRIEPMFLVKRPGRVRCVQCHERGAGALRFQPLTNGVWTEEASRKNLAAVSAFVVPGNPATSRLLQHPLTRESGGDPFHGGGKHWSTGDAEYPNAGGVGSRGDRPAGEDRRPHRSDQRGRRRLTRDRSRDQQGRCRHPGRRHPARRDVRAGRQPPVHQRRGASYAGRRGCAEPVGRRTSSAQRTTEQRGHHERRTKGVRRHS